MSHEGLWVCPECAHEWTIEKASASVEIVEGPKFLDSNKVQLQSRDTVRTVKDLKVGEDTPDSR
jgi:protein PhnA